MMALKPKSARSIDWPTQPLFLQAYCSLPTVLARAIASWENEGLSTITTKKNEMRKGQQREEFGQNAVSRFWLASHLPDKSRKEKKIKLAICDGREQLSYLAATLKLLMPLITTQRLVRLYEVVVYAFHYRYARPPNCFAPQAFAVHSNSQPRKSRVYDSSAIECCQNGFFCGKGQVGAC